MSPLPWAAAIALGAVLWIPLVLTPWRAADAASAGLGLPLASAERARALARASEIGPWDEHYAAELGRTQLARAYASPTREQTWGFLLEARAPLERAVRIAPESAVDRAMLALVMSAQSSLRPDLVHVSDVALDLRRVLAADSTSADVLDMVVSGYTEIDSIRAAYNVAVREARLYPDYARPLAEVGQILLAQGRYADAADTLGLAARRDWHGSESAEAKARANLANALLRLGRTQEAREEAERALRLSPSLPAARRVLDEAGRAPDSRPR